MDEIKYPEYKWFDLMERYSIELPKQLANRTTEIVFKKVDTRVTAKHVGYVPTCFPPLMVTETHAFNLSFPLTAISQQGEVIRICDGKIVNNYNPKLETHYTTTSVYDPIIDEYRDVVTHRMVGLTWRENDDYFNKSVLNHLDGNKQNPDIYNLEWTTQLDNHLHAIREGLREDTLECIVFDNHTNEVHVCNSYGEAKRMLGLSRLGNSNFIDGEFISKDGRYIVRSSVQAVERAKTNRQRYSLSNNTQTIVLPSLRETAKFLGVVRSTVKRLVRQSVQHNGWSVQQVDS